LIDIAGLGELRRLEILDLQGCTGLMGTKEGGFDLAPAKFLRLRGAIMIAAAIVRHRKG
jgi:hypothetical protein